MKAKRMFGSILVLVGSLIFVSCTGSLPGQRYISSQSRIERLNHGVVALISPTEETMREMRISDEQADRVNTLGQKHDVYCTGVWISRVEVLTAAHCVERTQTIQTIFGPISIPIDESPMGDLKKIATYASWLEDENFVSYKLFEVTEYNRGQDLALLTLTLSQTPPEDVVVLGLGLEPHQGDQVYVIGHPVDLAWSITDGIVSHPSRRFDGRRFTQASAQVFFGNSGGPLIDNQGQIVGIAQSIITPHLALFAHVKSIEKFLNDRQL